MKLFVSFLLLIALPQMAISEELWGGSFSKLNGRIIRSLAVASFDQDRIIAGNKGSAAGDATLFESQDGGISWRFLNANQPLHKLATDVQAVAYVSQNIILAGTWKHGLFRSVDNGASFQPSDNFPSTDIRGLLHTNSGLLFAATGDSGVLKSEDSGATWIQTSLQQEYIWSVSGNTSGSELLASSPTSGLYRSSDQGVTWKNILGEKTYESAAIDNSQIIAAATETGLHISKDSGSTWIQADAFKGQRLASILVAPQDPDTLLIGGWNKGFQKYSVLQKRASQISDLASNTASDKASNKASDPATIIHLEAVGNNIVAGSWGKGIHVYPYSINTNYIIDATKAQDIKTVKTLLSKGANPDSYDAQRNTPLIFASRDGFLEIAKTLINSGADVNWIDGENVTPLILASFKNHPAIVSLLLANGADKAFVDGFGRTAMNYAEKRSPSDPIVKILQSQ